MCMGLDGGIQSMQYRACEDGCLKMAMRQGIILVNDVLVRRSGVVLCRTWPWVLLGYLCMKIYTCLYVYRDSGGIGIDLLN